MKYIKTISYTINVNIALFFFHFIVFIGTVANDTEYSVNSIIKFFFDSVYLVPIVPLVVGYYIGYRRIKKKTELVPQLYVLINFLILCISTIMLMSSFYAPFPFHPY